MHEVVTGAIAGGTRDTVERKQYDREKTGLAFAILCCSIGTGFRAL